MCSLLNSLRQMRQIPGRQIVRFVSYDQLNKHCKFLPQLFATSFHHYDSERIHQIWLQSPLVLTLDNNE